MNYTKPLVTLSDDQIRAKAPSVFAQEAYFDNSAKYRFISTFSILNALRDCGYQVTHASQSRTLIPGKKEFTKHMLRMRHSSVINPANVGDELPEIVLVNSHDRTSTYQIMLGIFRLVCSNGLIVASSTLDSIRVRHSGKDPFQNIIDTTAEVAAQGPVAMSRINRLKEIPLSPEEQIAFATAASELSPSSMEIEPRRLLNYRRYDDRANADGTSNLWKTSNVIQENLIRGKILGRSTNGTLRRTSEIKSVKHNIDVNKALWTLTEKMAELKETNLIAR